MDAFWWVFMLIATAPIWIPCALIAFAFLVVLPLALLGALIGDAFRK
jgi:hypothetical protein